MSRRIRASALVSSLACALLPVFAPVMARANVSVTVEPLVVQFYALPGQSANDLITVQNSGDQPERIVAYPVDWKTLVDGSVVLEKPGAQGTRSLHAMLSMSPQQFVLQPGERRQLVLKLSVPASFLATPASYWGGFLVKATALKDSPYVTGPAATVFAYDDVGTPKRHLAIDRLAVLPSGSGSAKLVARLRNDGAGYLRIAAKVAVEQYGRIIRTVTVPVTTIFPGDGRVIKTALSGLPPGDYGIELSLDYGGSSIVDGVTTVRVR